MDGPKYKMDSTLLPDEQISHLLNFLDISNLKFFTNSNISLTSPPYNVDVITMTGTSDYIKTELTEIRSKLFAYFTEYAISAEAISDKIFHLSQVEIMISEKILDWDIRFPELYDSPVLFDLIDPYFKQLKVRVDQVFLNDCIKKEIHDHHMVRVAFLTLLSKKIKLEIQRILTQQKVIQKKSEKSKALDLLEIWLGLKTMGYLDNLKEHEIAIKRNEFLSLFGIADSNYNDKHNQIKKRKIPKFIFIENMRNALINSYEK